MLKLIFFLHSNVSYTYLQNILTLKIFFLLFSLWSMFYFHTELYSRHKPLVGFTHFANISRYKYIFIALICTFSLTQPWFSLLIFSLVLRLSTVIYLPIYLYLFTSSNNLVGCCLVLLEFGFLHYSYKQGIKFLLCLISHCIRFVLLCSLLLGYLVGLLVYLLLPLYNLQISAYLFFHHLFLSLLQFFSHFIYHYLYTLVKKNGKSVNSYFFLVNSISYYILLFLFHTIIKPSFYPCM